MAQPTPGTLNLTGANSLRWGRDFELDVTLLVSTGPDVALDLTGFASLQCEIRARDTAETLICTGAPLIVAPSTAGTIQIIFPFSGWVTGDEIIGTHKYDLVGLTPSTVTHVQLLEGRVDVRTSTTEVV